LLDQTRNDPALHVSPGFESYIRHNYTVSLGGADAVANSPHGPKIVGQYLTSLHTKCDKSKQFILSSSSHKTATTPAMAITAAAKLPICLASALAALPVAAAPLAEFVAEAPVARPVETTDPVVAVETNVVVQLQSEL